ncbi:MAG: type I-E CRISPR-associated protein Cse2/CasB [Nocardioidaceae bacterium]
MTIDETTSEADTESIADCAPTVSKVLANYVSRRAAELQGAYQADSPKAVATLARLRRVTPSVTGLDPDAWDIFEGMPERLLGRGDAPSRAELAAISSLMLFATHQQSRRDVGMSASGRANSLGRAVARLKLAPAAPGVERRFRALTRTSDLNGALQHLRGLIGQLRSERIPLDYGALARDLYDLQHPAGVHGVRMRWTRDFHRPTRDNADTPAKTGDQE